MVNKAIEEMVCMNHGEEVWERIRFEAGVDVDVFMSNEAYPDEVTYNLVAAASAVLEIPAATILEGFGEHWVLHTAQKGYGGLMQGSGRTLAEFLRNLPTFHDRVAMVFPNLRPPRFHFTELDEHSLKLHYFSHREGLAQFVVGLMQGLGKMYRTRLTVTQVEFKASGADHDIFHVQWAEPVPA